MNTSVTPGWPQRQTLIEEQLQSRAFDAVARLEDEIHWLAALGVPSGAPWPEMRELLGEAVAALAQRVNRLARDLAEGAVPAEEKCR
ncbi:MAG TPA: hypothetical protein VJ576_07425 [Rhodocyclaceae bacterium]|nr:hypothetical protein [Rhodocyclaceae bacterium]